MEFSLENPGFSMDVSDQVDIHQPDVSRMSSGSSASSMESTCHSCSRCHGRMSSFSLDRHMFCTKCRGSDCDQSTRCDDSLSWTKEELGSYIKLWKSLSSKSKNKSKSSLKTSSSPPRSTAPESDIDARLFAQLITVNKTIHDKISAMFNSLLSQFSEMLDRFRSSMPNSSFSVDPAVPGQSVSHTESLSLRHPVSTEYQRLRFQGDGVDLVPHGSGLGQGTGVSLDRPAVGADVAHSQDLPSEDFGNAQHPPGPAGPKVAFAKPLEAVGAHDSEEDDEDDKRDVIFI